MKLIRKNSRETLAYLAGIVDGEGCISISSCKAKDKRHPRHEGLIQVRMVRTEALQALRKAFGGIYESYYLTTTGKKYWYWVAYGERGKQVVKALLPFLKIKKKQALELLRFRKIVEGRKTRSYSKQDRRRLKLAALRMKALNA